MTENLRPPVLSAFTTASGEVVDPQTDVVASLKKGDTSLGRDPISPEMAALSEAQAAGKPLKVDPQPASIAILKQG